VDNDDVMDQLLGEAMAADAPQLSPAFDARVMRRVQPRRLTPMGRVLVAAYFVCAVAAAVWLMQDLRVEWIAAVVAVGGPVAAGVSVYSRRLALG
jgi:hypothetical protein